MGETKGLIFDIQGHSVHDGPGTRTVVFMSGCPLRCKWCANPEGQLLRRRLMYKAQFCMKCPLRCVEACPKGAARRSQNGSPPVLFDRSVCECCDSMDCSQLCYMQALQPSGRWYTVEEVMRILHRDQFYWGREGGITFSGGEPLVQQEFVLQLLSRCHVAGIAACVETNAYVSPSVMQSILPFVHWLFLDIKHMNSGKHAEGTGVPNQPILDNIRWLTSSGWPGRIIIRVPIIAGYNDSEENAQATADFLMQVGLREINLLPFHRLGAAKYEQLGLDYDYGNRAAEDPATLETLAEVYRNHGIACYLGSDTPF